MRINNKKLKIIQAGFSLMDTKGFNGTGISDIIAEADIPKGSFYHYFQNKVTFTAEVIDFYAQEVLFHLKEKLEHTNLPPLDRIKELYRGYAKSMIDTHTFPYGGFANKISQEVGHNNPIIQEAANKVFLSIKQAHIDCLRQAVEQNFLSKETNIENLAELIIFSWEGAIVRMKGSYTMDSLLAYTEMLDKLILKEGK
ncbi:MAG: TetR/AcrR family transcriptional regulator [Bacteroidales bacterium]|nr:TetR/AcrR family transcriptional regulator [Bacteroidales bacterium]MCF8457822.1 TetR/AcrR family transcriptional regulator [Bacteroidales bacterium]